MPRSEVRRVCAVVVMVASLIVGISCSSSTKSSSASGTGTSLDDRTPERGGKLVFGVTAEANSWDPTSAQWTVDSHLVASSFYEPLVAVGPNYTFFPQLAEAVTPNEDFTQWTIRTAKE